MPQLDLLNDFATPAKITLTISHIEPMPEDGTHLEARVFAVDGTLLASYGADLTDLEVEYLPRMLSEAALGYLYGESTGAVVKALKAVRRQARERLLMRTMFS